MYMSNMVKNVVSLVSGQEIETKWSDILDDLNGTVTPEKQTETEQEIKTRLLSKLNERGEA